MALKLKPWHEAVQLRPEILSGKVSQAIFVADVYDVMMKRAPEIYQDPAQFFATTYPTAGLVQLVKDVVQRLADKSDKAVRQLSQVYGGGKTHSLVTLYHLVSDPDGLPPAASVDEFKAACNVEIPKSRVVVLPFDKIDQVKGMATVSGVAGEPTRDLHQPWSILAYQLAGADGLRLLTGGEDTERNSAPAEPLLVALLQRAQQDGRAVLILMDEVLMYARGSVEAGSLDGQDQSRLTQLTNFFQYVTQAAVKTPRCALVASLLANEMNRNDTVGKQILQDLSNIFRRESEGDIEPVAIKDIGAVLARRFFTMDSIQKDHRANVRAALTGIKALDPTTQKLGEQAVDTYAKSFPFHPDLNEVFAGRWTALRTFQRTRGALRIFADALRDAAAWGDPSPLVSVNVFLNKPDSESLSTAAANLAGIAAENVTEGSQPNWSAILTKELEHAHAIQSELPSLAKYREVEQAVMATFLLSQPDGQRAGTADLLRLIGPTDPDRIELNKALLRWIDRSWYLDDATERASKSEKPGERPLPDHWRLGFVPNLNQIHHYAMERITNESVETHLDAEIRKNQSLISHIPSSVVSYRIPDKPGDVRDDGALQFVVLGASACSEPGKVSKEADRYLRTKGPDRPRKCKNAIVCIVPRRDGIETARDIVKDLLAWDDVVKEPNDLDEIRKATAKGNLATARKRVPDAIRQAFTLAAVWTTPLDVSAISFPAQEGPLFAAVKAIKPLNIVDSAITPDSILPGGPYDVWSEEENERRVTFLMDEFAQRPGLPRLVDRSVLLDTLGDACEQGWIVLRWRIGKSDQFETRWREQPESQMMSDEKMEDLFAILPQAASLTKIEPSLLAPGNLPGLWPEGADEISVSDTRGYFSGKRNYLGPDGHQRIAVPKADDDVVDTTIRDAVKSRVLWMIAGSAGLFGDAIPEGMLTGAALLRKPPLPIPVQRLTPENLPAAWSGGLATARALYDALSEETERPLPWETVQKAINDAINGNVLMKTITSPWPVAFADAANTHLQMVAPKQQSTPIAPSGSVTAPSSGRATKKVALEAGGLQDLAEVAGAVVKLAAGQSVRFQVSIEIEGSLSPEVTGQINALLSDVNDDLNLS